MNFNPEQFVLGMLTSGSNNPILSNLVNMAKKNDTKGIEQFARNFLKQKGYDFDIEYKKFKSNPVSYISNFK